MLVDREITIHLAPRSDGGLRAWSDDVPGLILSHADQEEVLADIGEVLIRLLSYKMSGKRDRASS